MNKSKMIMAVTGGLSLVVALVFMVLAWNTSKNCSEKEEEVEGVIANARDLVRKPIFPSEESVRKLKDNLADYTAWCSNALDVASLGDQVFAEKTAPAFKSEMMDQVNAFRELPGSVNGKIVEPAFTFGFKAYIQDGKIPSDGLVPDLQRAWSDVFLVLTKIQAAGASKIESVSEETVSGQQPEASARGKTGQKKAVASTRKTTTFTVSFIARPAALVKVLNALEMESRFIAVDSLSFEHTEDRLAKSIGGQTEIRSSRRRGRSRHGAAVSETSEEKDEEEKKGIVTSPSIDTPLKVTMGVSVHDFGRPSGKAAEELRAEASETKTEVEK